MYKLTKWPDIITYMMAIFIAAYGLCSMGSDNRCGIGTCIAVEYQVQTEAAAKAKDKCAEKTTKLTQDTKAASKKLTSLAVKGKDLKSQKRAPANLGDSSGDSC